jgi:uncharacterized protein (TIGR03086 family)
MMNEQQIFILADRALDHVVSQIKDDQWTMKLPEWFETGHTQEELDLKKIINYHAYDEAWVPEVVAGKSLDEVGQKYDGDLLGSDPKASFSKLVDTAVEAVNAVTDTDQTVHLSYGDFPLSEYLKHITSFRGFRAYDIARLIGVDTTLPPELVQGMWDELSPEIDEWRKMGVYGPAVPVSSDAPLQDRLLGMAGRNPKL